MLKRPLMYVTAGPMAGQFIIANAAIIAAARAGGYGLSFGVDKISAAPDRTKPHAAGEQFAALYADRQARAAMLDDMLPHAGYPHRMIEADRRHRAGTTPETDQSSPGSAPEGMPRKRARPPMAREAKT